MLRTPWAKWIRMCKEIVWKCADACFLFCLRLVLFEVGMKNDRTTFYNARMHQIINDQCERRTKETQYRIAINIPIELHFNVKFDRCQKCVCAFLDFVNNFVNSGNNWRASGLIQCARTAFCSEIWLILAFS